MRYIWTDAGDDPSWAVGDAFGITGYFFPAFDAITPATVKEAAQRGKDHGIYIGEGWLPGKSPTEYARIVNDYIKPIKAQLPKLRLQLNIEQGVSEVLAKLQAMRALQPNIGLSWSLMGMNGGLFTQGFVDWLVQLHVRVVPECFWGADGRMDGIYDSLAIARDITSRGVPDALVSPMIDAKYASLLRDWQGYAFTMGRLA
jgi:hypothetical protein